MSRLRSVSVPSAFACALSFAACAIALISAYLTFSMPSPKPADAPEDSFSAARAQELLRKAARVPHPVYSESKYLTIREIETFLRSGGFATWTTKEDIVSPRKKTGGSVTNIWARLKADNPVPGLKPIVLTAHFDSVPFGPGASDNGSGMAALAETARALAAMAPEKRRFRRDIVFIWTDGEEFGQLGAEDALVSGNVDPAFALAVDTAKDTPLYIVDLARNPSKTLGFLSRSNGRIIGFSWTDILKGALPVDSDYSPFRLRGIPGACVGSPVLFTDYHSARDTPENADGRAIQNAGDALIRCALALGASEERDFNGTHESYFSVGGIGLIRYPASLNYFFLASATLAILLGLTVPGRRPKAPDAAIGIGAALGLVVSSALVGIALNAAGGALSPDIRVPRYSAHLPNDWLWAAAAISLAIALFFSFARLGRNKGTGGGLCWGFAILTLTGGWVLAFAAPQASYLLAIPSFAFAAALLASVLVGRAHLFFPIASAISGVILIPLFPAVFLGLGLRGIAILVPAAAIVLLCWSPLFAYIPEPTRKKTAAAAGIIALAFAASAVCVVRFSSSVPEPTNLGYVLNADKSEAVWFVLGNKPTGRQLSRTGNEAADLAAATPFAPIIPSTVFHAPVFPVARPSVSVVSDRNEAGIRKLRLLASAGLEGGIMVSVPANSGFEALSIGGREYPAKDFLTDAGRTGDGKPRYVLTYYPCETKTLDIEFSAHSGNPFDVTVASLSDSLAPGVKNEPLPEGSCAQNDSTSVVRTYSFR